MPGLNNCVQTQLRRIYESSRAGSTTSRPFGREQIRDLPAVRVIPYEYVADFTLQADVGNLVQDVINVSVEGVFVAVSIGYGLDEERAESSR